MDRVFHSLKDENHHDADRGRDKDGRKEAAKDGKNSRERHGFRDLQDFDTRGSPEPGSKNGRDGSRDRSRDSVERDKGYMDDSVEREAHKRKEHSGEGYLDRSEKRSRTSDGMNADRRDKYRDSAERNNGYREDSVERRARKSKEHRGEGYLDKSEKRSRTSDSVNEEITYKYRDSAESNEDYRENYVERRAHKSKEQGGEGFLDKNEKRSRVLDSVNEERGDEGEKQRFKDQNEEDLKDAHTKSSSLAKLEKGRGREEKERQGREKEI